VAKGGLKMKASEDQSAPDPQQGFIDFSSGEQEDTKPLPRGAMRLTTGSADTILYANAVLVSRLVTFLQGSSDRIIMDKTNLTGRFDVHVRFRRETAPPAQTPDGQPGPGDARTPSLFTAMQELGLKLESAKAPLEVIVIDSVQKPSEN
jgi:uncharacterized protein (TIGR03435 family)